MFSRQLRSEAEIISTHLCKFHFSCNRRALSRLLWLHSMRVCITTHHADTQTCSSDKNRQPRREKETVEM